MEQLNIINSVAVAIAFVAVVRFYVALKPRIAQHKTLAKLLALKLIVGLTFLEEVSHHSELRIFLSYLLNPNPQIIFWILKDAHILGPTATLTYADVTIGIPTLMICIQNVPLAIFFHYAYPYTPYILPTVRISPEQPRYTGGFCGLRAWIAIFNSGEFFRGLLFTFKMASLLQKKDYTALTSEIDLVRREGQ